MNPKAISLSAELAEVRCAIAGARFIADALATHSLDSREQELQAPVSITAILVLAELRLQQVERVLRGEEDPQHLWAPHNDVTPDSGEGDKQDLVLRPWSQAKETKEPAARKKLERSGPRKRRGQAPSPEPEPPAQPEGGGEQPPPGGTPS
ncbi:hypothetical protein [Myxococcus sp. CA040A]|uniref:hypothetical protein n=1 Tax=Myxococcus sp. CA040A TaxID=2741738 RepID=UPI00157B3D22|nr:hypothetical protein [Myxococcus sp. CA040A]NTX08011.1 hypothetical protein [Myxococcus sp. CA040A]